jgi:hypothetical protein
LSARGSRQRGRREDRVKQEIIALSLKYGLMSRETSFVAVERRETPVEGDVKLRKVPVALTTGWGGKRRPVFAHAQRLHSLAVTDVAPMIAASSAPSISMQDQTASFGETLGTSETPSRFDLSRLMPRLTRRPPSSRTQALIVLQTAEGFWDLENELASIIGRGLEDLRSAIKDAAGPQALVARAWATALALAWLELNAGDTRDEWRMLSEKARRWLDRAAILPPDGVDWLRAAHRFITR